MKVLNWHRMARDPFLKATRSYDLMMPLMGQMTDRICFVLLRLARSVTVYRCCTHGVEVLRSDSGEYSGEDATFVRFLLAAVRGGANPVGGRTSEKIQ